MTNSVPKEAILSENELLFIFNEIKTRNNISLNIQDPQIKEWCIQMGIYVYKKNNNLSQELFLENIIFEIQLEIENEIEKKKPISGTQKAGQIKDERQTIVENVNVNASVIPTISKKIQETQLKLQNQLKCPPLNKDINSETTELMDNGPKHLRLIQEPPTSQIEIDSILTSQCSDENE